jgi:hypothetical protein
MAKKKKSKTPAEILSDKKDKLDWNTFNLLENLLVFCIVKDKNAPAESPSGVKFRITPHAERKCLCLLFHIDRPKDPLIRGEGIARPDYMALFIENNNWVCTIIEMKGMTERGFKRGIEQVKVLRDVLKEEMKTNAAKLKIKFQAIMLIPFNSQIPRNLITREKSNGFVILPLQYAHKAELFNYVSKENQLTERYKHENFKKDENVSFIEDILTNNALPRRIKDNFYNALGDKVTNQEGIYINYALLENENYAALAINDSGIKIGVKESEKVFQEQIQNDLQNLGLTTPQHFKIVEIN